MTIEEAKKSQVSSILSPMETMKKGNFFKVKKVSEEVEVAWATLQKKLADFQKETNSTLKTSDLVKEYTKVLDQVKEITKKA